MGLDGIQEIYIEHLRVLKTASQMKACSTADCLVNLVERMKRQRINAFVYTGLNAQRL